MIVKCEQCQTRFKIPDEKVTEKGVKVRCTKCGHTFRVTRDMAQVPTGQFPVAAPPPRAPKPAEVDPFERYGSAPAPGTVDPSRPGLFSLGPPGGPGPTRSPPAPPAAVPSSPTFDFATLVPPPARPAPAPAPAPFDFSVLAPAPAEAAPPAGKAFDFSALTAAPPAAAVPPRAAPGGPLPAFDFSALEAPPERASPAAGGPSSPSPAAVAFDFSSLGPPPPAAAPARPQSSAPLELDATGAPPGAAEALGSPPARTDEFFGAPMAAPPTRPLLDLPEDLSDEQAKQALFDLPRASPARPPVADPAPAPVWVPLATMSAAPVAPPAAPTQAPPPPRRGTPLGVVVNVLIAAVLVVGLVVVGSALLNDGALSAESLSPAHLKAVLLPQSDYVAHDISNGLYETSAGRPLFFVRGAVLNRGATATRVTVTAEIVEGSKVVRSAEGLVGAVPTPEELYTLGAGEELEQKLKARVVPRAVSLAPGDTGAFLVVFTEYPPDLKDFRVRVVARAEGSGTTARRP